MSLYVDISEFLLTPIPTGIQRVVGEVCRQMPDGAATPVRLLCGRYVALPPALINAIGRHFSNPSAAGLAEIHRLASVENPCDLKFAGEDVLLVPEIFGENRAAFFRTLSDSQIDHCRFIIFDLLPYTHPEYFLPDMSFDLGGYYQTVRRASSCGFISEHTRDVFYQRLKRTNTRAGVVLPLGSDSLGPRTMTANLDRPFTFTVLGTIEPRKNHPMILEAFEPLLRHIKGLELAFVGKMGWVDSEFAEKVSTMAKDSNSGLKFFSCPDDGSIRSCIERSRATIYVSAAEGYGLPPVESLWLGTPVIASAAVPSLRSLGSRGVHVVEPLNVLNLRRAVLAFLENDYAYRKTEETASLNLPTWKSFADEVLAWCTSQ